MGIRRGRPLTPAVFLDRDGVVNEAVVRDGRPHPPASADELRLDPAAADVVRRLRANGFQIVVVTNQPDVARGTTTLGAVGEINERIRASVNPDALYTCFHDTADDCACRKPKPGMLLSAADQLGLDLARSYMVGDRWSDIEAGRRAGCRTVWLERAYEERAPIGADAHVMSLPDACKWILDDSSNR